MSVSVFTTVLPFILLIIIAAIIYIIIVVAKITRRYFRNSVLIEKKILKENEAIKEIKKRLSRLEEILKDVD